jgi:hypothetical protein
VPEMALVLYRNRRILGASKMHFISLMSLILVMSARAQISNLNLLTNGDFEELNTPDYPKSKRCEVTECRYRTTNGWDSSRAGNKAVAIAPPDFYEKLNPQGGNYAVWMGGEDYISQDVDGLQVGTNYEVKTYKSLTTQFSFYLQRSPISHRTCSGGYIVKIDNFVLRNSAIGFDGVWEMITFGIKAQSDKHTVTI